MSPYGLQDKVQALRIVPKSSTIDPAHLSRLISCCVLSLSHTHTTYALVILNSWPVPPNRLSLFRCQGSYSCSCFCLQPPHSTQAHTRVRMRARTHTHTHTHTHTRTHVHSQEAPLHELPSVFQDPAREALSAPQAELTTSSFMSP